MNNSYFKKIIVLSNENDVKWLKQHIHDIAPDKSNIRITLTSSRAQFEYSKNFQPSKFSKISFSIFSLTEQENNLTLQNSKKLAFEIIFNLFSKRKTSSLLTYFNVNVFEINYESLYNDLYVLMYATNLYQKIRRLYPHVKIFMPPLSQNHSNDKRSIDEYIRFMINHDELENQSKDLYAPVFPVYKKNIRFKLNSSKPTVAFIALGTRLYSMQLVPIIRDMSKNDWQVIYLSPYIQNNINIPNELKGLSFIPLNCSWFVDDNINHQISKYFKHAKELFNDLTHQIDKSNFFKLNNYSIPTYFLKQIIKKIFSEKIFTSLYYINCANNFFSKYKIDLLIPHTGAPEFCNVASHFGIEMVRFPHGIGAAGFDISTAFMGKQISYGHFKLINLERCGIRPDKDLMMKSYLHNMDNMLAPYINNYKHRAINYKQPTCIICDNIHATNSHQFMQYGNQPQFVDTVVRLAQRNPSLQIILRIHHGFVGEVFFNSLKELEKYGIFVQNPSPNNCLTDMLPYVDFVIMTGFSSSLVETLIRGRPVVYYTNYLSFLGESNGFPNKSVYFTETETDLFDAVERIMNISIDSNVVQYKASNLIDGYTSEKTISIGHRLKKFVKKNTVIKNYHNTRLRWKNACFQSTKISEIDRVTGISEFRHLFTKSPVIFNDIIFSEGVSKRIISLKYIENVISVLNDKDKNPFIPFSIELFNESFYKIALLIFNSKLKNQSMNEIFRNKRFIIQAVLQFSYICKFLEKKLYFMDSYPTDLLEENNEFKIITPEKIFTVKSLEGILGINPNDALHLLKMNFDKNFVLPILINYYCKGSSYNYYMRNRSIFLTTKVNQHFNNDQLIVQKEYLKWLKLTEGLRPEDINDNLLRVIEDFLLDYKIET